MANIINATYPPVLRAANTHQTQLGLLYAAPSLRTMDGVVGSTTWNHGLRLVRFEVHNRAGAASSAGVGYRWANRFWEAGTLTAADVYTRVAALQTPVATAVQVAGLDQQGFCVMSPWKFSWVAVNFTTAETDNDAGGEITHTVQYSNAAGTGWTTVAAGQCFTNDLTTAAGTEYEATPHDFVWEPPADWGPSATLSATIPNGMYVLAFRVAGREANDVAAQVTGIEVGSGIFVDTLADNAIYASEEINFIEPKADAVVAYFADADAGNRVYAEVMTWF